VCSSALAAAGENANNALVFAILIHWIRDLPTMRVSAPYLLCLLFALCGSAAFAADAGARSFSEVLAAHTLRVGVYPATPYVIKDAAGKLTGSEIDIANRLAKDMGVTAEFRQYTQWEQLIPALRRGEIDIIASGLSITPERALQVYFSKPYADSGVGIATNIKLTSGFASLEDLNRPDVAIGVVGGSVSEQVARELFSKAGIKTFTSESAAEDALVKGLLHAYVRSEPAPRFLALRHPKEVDVPIGKPLLETREAFAVRKGDNDFINFLNAWIEARTADAWLTSTHKYWFESLDWEKHQERVAK
jgi:polar amino acid transport system substrate-binding protein